jgi:hypothetical protein
MAALKSIPLIMRTGGRMSITQTVEVPDSRRLTIEVPREIPVGPVIITFTPREVPAKEQPQERVYGCSKGKYHMAEDFDAPLEDFKDYM